MVKNGIFLLLMLLFTPGTVMAAHVYLKDGGYIECLLAKQQGKTVHVIVNRNTETTLDRNEVAIKKTFGKRNTIGSWPHYKH